MFAFFLQQVSTVAAKTNRRKLNFIDCCMPAAVTIKSSQRDIEKHTENVKPKPI